MNMLDIINYLDSNWGNFGNADRTLSTYVDSNGYLATTDTWPETIDLLSIIIVKVVNNLYDEKLSDIDNLTKIANALEVMMDRMDTLSVALRDEIHDHMTVGD